MIYICSGIGALCKAPCLACRGMCKCCDEGCKALRSCWSPIVDNPLGMFVLGTWAMQLLVCLCAGYAFSGINDECKAPDVDCAGVATCETAKSDAETATSNAQVYLGVMFLIAIIHCTFAFYIQRKLVWEIEKADPSTPVSKLISEILKRDIPFCLYFFFAIGAFCYCIWGMNSGSGDNCKLGDTTKVQTGTGGVAMVSIIYGILTPCYACCFIFGKVSSDTVGQAQASAQKAKEAAQAPATSLGKPSA